MPKYLAIDFLAQALRQKDQLISRMLLSCPGSEEIEPILQVGEKHNKNEKQDFWLRDNAQSEKLSYEKLDSCLLKLVSSPFGRKPESFQVKHKIEVVPSSNPDSPTPSYSDSFYEFEDEIVQDVCNYLNQNERNSSTSLLCQNDWEQLNDRKEFEEMVLPDCFEEFLRRIPHFLQLAARLKPGRVTDPFLDKNGQLKLERLIICHKFNSEDIVKGSTFRNELKEVFKKYSLQFEQKKDEAGYLSSPIIVSPYTCDAEYFNNLTGSTTEEDEGELDKHVKDIQRTFKCQKWSECQDYEVIPKDLPQTKNNSFIQLNETAGQNHELVKTLPPLLLESPPPYDNLWSVIAAENIDDIILKENGGLQPFNIETEISLNLCSPQFQYKIARKIDASSKLLDKISSLILEVPDLKEKRKNEQTTTLCNLPCFVKEDFTSELELKLRWDPLPKSLTASVPNLQMLGYQDDVVPNIKHTYKSPLSTTISLLPWKDVYASSDGVSTKCLDVVKEIKLNPSLVVSTGQAKITNKAKKSTDIDKNCSHIYSEIDDFVLLRTGVKSSASRNYLPKAIVKAMTVEPKSVEKTEDDNPKETRTEQLDYVERVPLCKDFQIVFTSIQKYIQPILLQLQETGCLSPSYTTDNITADYTRFILKQEEKKKVDGLHGNGGKDNQKYRMLVSLHALVIATELVKECGLSVAQDYIKTVNIQYRKSVAGALDHVIDDIIAAEQRLINIQLAHPKVMKTCELIREWLPQPLFSMEEKILVVTFRGFREIYLSLFNQLQKVKGLKTAILDEKTEGFSVISNAHVVMTDIVSITEHFPWSSFTSVIVYEDKHEWLRKVLNERPVEMKHIVCLKGLANINQHTQDACKALLKDEKPKRETYSLIGSTKVTRNVELLMCLEQKYDIIIIEREYEKIVKSEVTTRSKMCLQPDLLLDEKAGVIIENIIDFASEEGYKNAVDLVLSTSFKCQMCNIILACDTNGSSAYSFLGEVQSNLAKFHGCLVSIQSSFPQFVIDVFYSHSILQTATLIRRLCEITRDSSNDYSKNNWVKRDWLSDEISEHERFLLSFPSLNSFSAQLMLSKMPINMLLSLPFTTLRKELPWIPDSTLKDFKKIADCGLVLEQVSDRPELFSSEIQLPLFPEEVEHNFSFAMCTDMQDNNKRNKLYVDREYPSADFERTSQYFTQMSPSFSMSKPKLDLGSIGGSSITHQMTEKDWEIATSNESNFINGFVDTREGSQVEFHGLNDVNYGYHFERRPESRSIPPAVRGTFEQICGGVPITFNNSRSTCKKGEFKTMTRSSKSLRGGNETPDAVGVVQPKPRKIEKSRFEKPGLVQPTRNIWGMEPQYSEKIPYSSNMWQEKEGHYEKPQKKRKLTFEVVPGAKNGQTRLTFV